jgi:hypothetical protein
VVEQQTLLHEVECPLRMEGKTMSIHTMMILKLSEFINVTFFSQYLSKRHIQYKRLFKISVSLEFLLNEESFFLLTPLQSLQQLGIIYGHLQAAVLIIFF